MRRRTAAALALSIVALVGGATSSSATPLDDDYPYPQVHGEMVVGVPHTASCTVTLTKDFPFRNTAYGSDKPYRGTYTPSCPGPWSKVVMTMSANVKPGTQFDRIGDVMLGGAELLHFTTPEGAFGTTSWSIQRDITAYRALLESPQQAFFTIGNQTDGTYTGIFYGTLSFTFYAGSAPATPDLVVPVGSTDTSPVGAIGSPTQRIATSTVFPQNLTQLKAEVFTSGHGGCEEDWWYQPFACAGTPYREAAVYVDDKLAGVAPIFPALFTGGWGPDWWRPIPGPRTLDLRPYELDLTPFVGTLTDNEPHTVSVGILNWTAQSGDYWPTTANLLGWVNQHDTGRTKGEVTSYTAPAMPTFDGQNSADLSTSEGTFTHVLSITGWTEAPGLGRSTVTVSEQLADKHLLVAAATKSDWDWVAATRTAFEPAPNQKDLPAGTTVDSTHAIYQLVRDGARFAFVDKADRVVTEGGKQTFASSLDDRMQTSGPALVTGLVGASQESWNYRDSVLGCVDHELAGAMNQVLRDDVSTTCPVVLPPVT